MDCVHIADDKLMKADSLTHFFFALSTHMNDKSTTELVRSDGDVIPTL